MDSQLIYAGLPEFDQFEVEQYVNYCNRLLTATKSGGSLANPWMNLRSESQFVAWYKAVARDGLKLDGENITIQSTGVSYNYIAYKNMMFLKYPESVIDLQMVHDGDTFKFRKESGHVQYTHEISDPFSADKESSIVGGYCVIKNKRGEFLTTLSREEIDKHRKVAKTDYIWKQWFIEMCMKTIMKKSCKQHFKDIFQNIETIDNENYDLGQPLAISLETKQDLEVIDNQETLEAYYRANVKKNAGVKQAFIDACANRKEKITELIEESQIEPETPEVVSEDQG